MNAPKLFTSTHNSCRPLPPCQQDTAADAPAKCASAAFSFEPAAPVCFTDTEAVDTGVADRSPVLAAPVTSLIASVLRMRTLPYRAINDRRFILDIAAFERALESA
jgi:hypothetical protein